MVRLVLVSILCVLFSSCESLGRRFRSSVESAEFTVAGTSDKAGNYGGTIGTKLTFRDPRRTTASNK